MTESAKEHLFNSLKSQNTVLKYYYTDNNLCDKTILGFFV